MQEIHLFKLQSRTKPKCANPLKSKRANRVSEKEGANKADTHRNIETVQHLSSCSPSLAVLLYLMAHLNLNNEQIIFLRDTNKLQNEQKKNSLRFFIL